MANNGIVVGGVIATAAIIFAVFVSFNSITNNPFYSRIQAS